MLRSSSSSSSSVHPFSALQTVHYHSTRKNEEEAALSPAKAAEVIKKDSGFLGTGLSSWYALPVAMVVAVPAIKFEWLIINEEFQLAAVFVAFCVTLYTQGGDAIAKAFEEKSDAILKEQNEAEDKVIQALQEQLTFLRASGNMVEDFEAINAIREETYQKLNEAGKVKPLYEFKSQVEKLLNMIEQEEASVGEKTKIALLKEATESVYGQFASNKQLKKAALDSAIASIKGDKATDPVQSAFINFFKAKSKSVTKEQAAKEGEEQRAALVAKMNAIAKTEGFMFNLDGNGVPKMLA